MPVDGQFGAKARIAAGGLGGAALVAMIVVGCSAVTGGTAQVDTNAAPEYRASVSASITESSLSSVTRESQRQASLTTRAIHTVCEDLSTSAVDAVEAVNAYVEAVNNGGDTQAKAGPAIAGLNRSADLVSSGLSDALSADLRAALTDWVDSARALVTAISTKVGPDQFNTASTRSNTARENALNRCDAAYR
ncbi:hypothetical protein M2272_001608 [Mycobacterium frederiksbergense]|uniref:Lipoprotein n=1 Tax=Mycolicibacterium frederiksbergense TaxID=117567 RepID=A0ABT6KWA0_9MYCO|nr:hypothetical protein [Mycolicibacterium frederiksbergense]MDH6194979.1 hypothetical protein [Mycolicibacterium frederiksbergense]